MCLGVPGKVLEIYQQDDLPMGKIEFGGIVKEACLAYTPEAEVGDYVLVHVGFAISRLDEAEAQEVFSYLDELGQIEAEMRQADQFPPGEPRRSRRGKTPPPQNAR